MRDSTGETQQRHSSSFSQETRNPPEAVQSSSDWVSNVEQNNGEVRREQLFNDTSLNASDAAANSSMPTSGIDISSHAQSQSLSSFSLFNPESSHGSLDITLLLNADSPPSPRLTTYTPDTGGFRGDTTSPDNITNWLAARMGSLQIAEDGQLRYYGPTSNLHLYHSGLQSLSRSTIRHVATEGSEVLRRAGLDQKIPLAVEIHLAHLYFSWEDPAIHVVDEEIFFLEKQK
jgi:hypothetical protein